MTITDNPAHYPNPNVGVKFYTNNSIQNMEEKMLGEGIGLPWGRNVRRRNVQREMPYIRYHMSQFLLYIVVGLGLRFCVKIDLG